MTMFDLFECKLQRFSLLFFILSCSLSPLSAIHSLKASWNFRFNAAHKANAEDLWFTQKLDHFNGADDRVWKQRYFINDTFHHPGGPVFLMIGGEGPANPAWMQHGTWLVFAQKFGALCLMLEHRYYGKSHPTEDLSVENLVYLSSKQALGDLAHFRTEMAQKMGLTNSKWVAFGGSYPGSLAAWFRLKYPHLVHAAVASSAPVKAVVNFPEYLEVVQRSLTSYSAACPQKLKYASDTLVNQLKDTKNYDKITKDFRLCDTLKASSDSDLPYFLETLAGNFMDVVQYNEDNREFEGVPGTNITIKVLCNIMEDESLGTPYDRYASVAHLIQTTLSQKCLDVKYKNYVKDMSNSSWDGPASGGGRQWVYQTCSEFGFYQTTDSPNQPFSGFSLVYNLKQCSDIFGSSFTATLVTNAVQQTNEDYGGYDIKSSRIVFPNGSIDPWHALGITKDITSDLPAIFIEGTAHCANMYPARPEDPLVLTLARGHVLTLLEKWLL
ncbi:thymus-specific serine protease [Erpetoichthys calabaricus]|uniref:Serine protease 59, putative n=1 Tax=Erpetoichthys calabaricus TaxID=27687 RepID=A0A8C4X720_ERPCA|nr:thymus-specific serine protease [Erpetoichthys calabaricus]